MSSHRSRERRAGGTRSLSSQAIASASISAKSLSRRSSASSSKTRDAGPDGVHAQVLDEQAERAQEARARRHDDGADAQLARERGGMQRAGAAEGQEREAGRVDTALHGHQAHGARHVGVDDGHDAARGLDG